MAYDRAITVFSPDGRLFQVEYAREAVKRGTTTIGLKFKDGVALIIDKRVSSRLIEPFSIENVSRRATHYLLDIEVEGLTGVLAKLLGKDPPPLHTWMLGGDAPTFVRFRGFLYPGGPVWSIELASPAWPPSTEP